jgi:hypothetical protein
VKRFWGTWIGGSCPNINCLLSKNEIWSARVAELIRHARRIGGSPSSSRWMATYSLTNRKSLSMRQAAVLPLTGMHRPRDGIDSESG